MQPILPARRFFGSSPPQRPSLAGTETKPMQLGPSSFKPLALATSVSCCCNFFPCSPPSAKPSAKMTPAFTAFLPSSSTTPTTVLVLTAITARGISPGTSRTLGYVFKPKTSGRPGLIDTIRLKQRSQRTVFGQSSLPDYPFNDCGFDSPQLAA